MSNVSNVVLRAEDSRVGRGLAAAAFVGWGLIAGSIGLLVSGLSMPAAGKVGSYIAVTAVFGLPISLLFCFTVGLVGWLNTIQRPWVRKRDAARVGAIVGLVLYALWGGLTFLSIAASRSHPRLELHDLLQFVLVGVGAAAYAAAVGAAAGLAAWWAGGRKSILTEAEAAI